jgi:mycothiol synthase
METRPASADDVQAIAELQRRWETARFGAPEQDEDEVRESFDRAEVTRVLLDDARIVAAAWCSGIESTLVVDPDAALAPVYADLLPWVAARPGTAIEALDQDEVLRAALDEHGWRHVRSSFELMRAVTPDFVLAEPQWPEGVTAREFSAADAAAAHQLIYVEAGWTEVPGHHERRFDEWRDMFITENTVPEQQVLAWRGAKLAGLAMGRTFSDGTGWIAQLAMAKDERGRGLARALLLEAFRRRRDAGATTLGLAVSEANRGALKLYLGVGLEITREWMEYTHPS